MPSNLLLTPGSQLLDDLRPDVSSHNTWLDILGDLGTVGLILFVSIFVIAVVGFVRPRWLQTRELSMTLFVMMLPVLSGSFFLPLLNNKVGWALLGLSASLQVPSVKARWSGLAGALGPPGTTDRTPVPLDPVNGAEMESLSHRPEVPGGEVLESIELARWDLRVSRRFRLTVLAVGLILAVVFGAAGGSRPTTYTATAGIWVPLVDGSLGTDRVKFDGERLQGALTLGVSGAFAQELVRVAGLDLSVDEVREGLDATRPRMGSYVEISYTDDDRANVEAVLPHLVDSLDQVYADAQDFALAETENELRPVMPGESRVYTGPAYLDAFPDPEFSVNAPRTSWYAFVGFLVGALAATGIMLGGQRRPRVTSTDDLREHVGSGPGRTSAAPPVGGVRAGTSSPRCSRPQARSAPRTTSRDASSSPRRAPSPWPARWPSAWRPRSSRSAAGPAGRCRRRPAGAQRPPGWRGTSGPARHRP